jgi:hypothetical protein
MTGTGTCSCVAGHDGPACQFSDAYECNDNGQVNFDGTCDCDPGFLEPNCCPPGSTGPGGCNIATDLIFADGFDPTGLTLPTGPPTSP